MLRLGRISYVNMAPVFYRVDTEVEEIQGVPTELNRRLIRTDKYDTALQAGDEVEIVTFVGGG